MTYMNDGRIEKKMKIECSNFLYQRMPKAKEINLLRKNVFDI